MANQTRKLIVCIDTEYAGSVVLHDADMEPRSIRARVLDFDTLEEVGEGSAWGEIDGDSEHNAVEHAIDNYYFQRRD
jgi:hypothetical protein